MPDLESLNSKRNDPDASGGLIKSAALVKSALMTSSAVASPRPATTPLEDLFFSNKTKMLAPGGAGKASGVVAPLGGGDVLTRLDSLVSGGSSPHRGILKSKDTPPRLPPGRTSIRFPEDPDQITEVIGYGGDENYDTSSDEDDAVSFKDKMDRFKNGGGSGSNNKSSKSISGNNQPEEITQEEKDIMQITRKNTTFNSVSKNLLEPPKAKLKFTKSDPLKTSSKTAPLVTVRPFGGSSDEKSIKPLVKKTLVTTSFSNPEPLSSVAVAPAPAQTSQDLVLASSKTAPPAVNNASNDKVEVNSGGGGGRETKLTSDGSSENSSSCSDDFESSSTTSSSSGEAVITNHLVTSGDSIESSGDSGKVDEVDFIKESSVEAEVVVDKRKDAAASARATFLNSTVLFPSSSASAGVSGDSGVNTGSSSSSGTGSDAGSCTEDSGKDSGVQQVWPLTQFFSVSFL